MSRRIVVDASAIVELVMTGPRARKLLDVLTAATEVMAPDLLFSEVANALWKYVRAGAIEAESAVSLCEKALDLVDSTVPARELAKEALVAAVSQGHPVYDMCYAVLARREGCTVCTLDKAFARVLASMSVAAICPAR